MPPLWTDDVALPAEDRRPARRPINVDAIGIALILAAAGAAFAYLLG